ncbi:LIM domain-containing protein 2 isoform X2 [Zalophus californianus]|uniref:LIM domain-containing protein 2 isoform X2 n=1 Tax=Zalophus californianus TaxID=9704 RepID=A0A6J2AW94_ZALCA|nr:LIM domain-containing protein 2 isoform X2 [Zalophus californianus]
MGGRGAGAGGGGAAIRRWRWRWRPLGDHWQRRQLASAPSSHLRRPPGDQPPAPRPRPGPRLGKRLWGPTDRLPLAEPSGCRVSTWGLHHPHRAMFQAAEAAQATPSHPGQLCGTARGILLQTPLSAAV